jgi:hypothetical protein
MSSPATPSQARHNLWMGDVLPASPRLLRTTYGRRTARILTAHTAKVEPWSPNIWPLSEMQLPPPAGGALGMGPVSGRIPSDTTMALPAASLFPTFTCTTASKLHASAPFSSSFHRSAVPPGVDDRPSLLAATPFTARDVEAFCGRSCCGSCVLVFALLSGWSSTDTASACTGML